MSEWWTYRLSDFLMFSPRTYGRLVEQYNSDMWPAQFLALAAGLVATVLALSGRPAGQRVSALLLGAAWLWVGWAFHLQRYAPINWAATYLAAASVVEALLLAGWAIASGNRSAAGTASAMPGGHRVVGLPFALAGLVVYPLAGVALGRPLAQVEVFGLMPEPTALVTLGLVMVLPHCTRLQRWMLGLIPLLSLLIGAATQWAMAG